MSEQLDFSQYLYERRYNAQNKIDEAKIIKRKAMVAGAIGAVVIFAVMVAFILGAYDREQVALFFALVVLYFALVVATFYIYGAIQLKSIGKFYHSVRLISKWEDVIEAMDKIEAKYAETGATVPKKEYEHMEAHIDYIQEGGYYLIRYEKGFLRAWGAIKVTNFNK